MRTFANLSIKSKITTVIMLACLAALLAACAAFVANELFTFRRNLVQELTTWADLTARSSSAAVDFDRADDAQKTLDILRAESQILAAAIYKNGQLWASFPPGRPAGEFPPKPEPPGHRFEADYLEMFRPILDPNNREHIGTVYIRASLQRIYARLRQYVGIAVGVLVVASLLSFAVSARLQGVISKPILKLSRTARTISDQKDYALRAEKQSQDEVGALIDSFNDMLVQIQKRDLELRKARDTAEQANRAKSTFLSFMSHELRTPLTAINGFSEMLIADVQNSGRREWVDDLRRINESGNYLLELINDILDLSKIEAGKMEVHVETFDVGRLVREAGDALRPLMEKRSNRLLIECHPDLGAVHGDLIKVRQCLLNLLSNASKFTERGQITLSAERWVKDGQDWLRFRVKDTGIGMTPEQMSKLFRVFAQAEESTSRRYGGTGLGLALTKQFCQIMGGTITVASEPGRGSAFTIELPAALARRGATLLAPAPAPTPTAPLPRPSSGCILVIDDDPAVHKLLAAALRQEGCRVEFASSGAEGLRKAKELRPAVITLDVIMPEMDGWVVLSLLKADPELASIPVIMLTVREEQDFAFAMGVADYLQKPIDRDRLVGVLHKYQQLTLPVQVLVVEDEPAMRDMIRRMLEREDWSVAEADNGLTALNAITQSRPSLIILDILMPVMDGFQFVAELQKHEDWRRIPVVVVSAKELTLEDRQRLQGFVRKILQKGAFTRDQLLAEVKDTVRFLLQAKPTA